MRTKLMYLFLICALPCALGVAQWEQSNGPFGGNITGLVPCPNGAGGSILLAATPGGVFRSTNKGDSWTPSSKGLTVNQILGVLLLGTEVFAWTPDGGVFRSTDSGLSWSEVNAGLTTLNMYTLGVGPQKVGGPDLYAGTEDGLFRSTNHGLAWSKVYFPPSPVPTLIAALGPYLYVGMSEALFRTSDEGMTWTCASCGFWQWNARALIALGTTLYAGTYDGVYISSDSGATWAQSKNGLTNPSVASLALNGSHVFAGTYGGGVFASTDKGASWASASAGLTNLDVISLIGYGTDLIAGTANGAFRSSDSGVTWVEASSGLAATYVVSLVADGANVFASNYGGVFFSPNSGGNWTLASNGLPSVGITALAVSKGIVYAAIYFHGIFHSTDNGSHWTDASSGLTDNQLRCLGVSGTTLFAGTEGGGIFRSTNAGETWTPSNEGLTFLSVWAIFASGGFLFAGTDGGGVFRSTNDGASWAPANTDLTSSSIRSFAVVGTDLFVGTADRGVFRSTNNGTTWVPASWGLMNNAILTLATSGTKLFAGTQSGGVFLSTDNGGTWSEANTGLKKINIQALSVVGENLLGATYGSGVWRRPISEFQPSGGPNIVKNPGFESGRAPWIFYTNATGDFSDAGPGSGSPHAGSIRVGGAGTNVQLYQPGLSLKEGDRYRLSFKAYSPGGHDLRVFMHKHGAPYTEYGLSDWECDLTGEWKLFVIEFKARNFSGTVNDARLRLWLAPYAVAGDRYYVDDVVLEKVGIDPSVQPDVVINGGFESDGKPWEFFTNGAGSFDTDQPGVQSDHSGHIKIAAAGSNVQLYEPGIELQEGARYTIRLKAYSPTAAKLDLYLHKHGAPYTNYGLNWIGVQLNTYWTYHYGPTFTATNVSGTVSDARLRLWLAPYARAGDEYFFDDISLTKELGSPSPGMDKFTVEGELTRPQETALAQNYPNPFNPVTNIQFSVGARQTTTIKVFDLLGREIVTLINEVKEPGTYTVQFDGSALPSGLYFYRLQAGSFTDTKRLVLVK